MAGQQVSFFGAVVLPDATPSQTCLPHRLRITQASLGEGVTKLSKGDRIVGMPLLAWLWYIYLPNMCKPCIIMKYKGIVIIFKRTFSDDVSMHDDTALPKHSVGYTETERTARISRWRQVLSLYARGICTFFPELTCFHRSSDDMPVLQTKSCTCHQQWHFSKGSMQPGSRIIMTRYLSCQSRLCFERLCYAWAGRCQGNSTVCGRVGPVDIDKLWRTASKQSLRGASVRILRSQVCCQELDLFLHF